MDGWVSCPVQIHDADGKPLLGAWVGGSRLPDWGAAIQCDKAECSVYQLEAGKPRLLVLFHPARKLAGTLALKGDVLRLGCCGAELEKSCVAQTHVYS
jgi:hypothetical protein